MTYAALARRMWDMLRGRRTLFLAVACVAVASAVASGVGDPLFQKAFFDSIARRQIAPFVVLALLLVGFYTAIRGLNYAAAITTQRLKNELSQRLTFEMLASFFGIAYTEVTKRDRGYFMSRVYDEPTQVATDLVDASVALLRGAAMFIGALIVTVWLSWQVALALSVIVPVLLYLARRVSGKIAAAARQESEEEATFRDGLGRAIDAYKVVSIFALFRQVQITLAGLLGAYQATRLQRVRYGARFQAASNVFLSYAELAVLVGAGVQVLRGQLTIGGLFAFMAAYWRVVGSFDAITAQLPIIARARGQLGRIDEFIALPKLVPRNASPGVALRDVSFNYAERDVLRTVELTVEPGEHVLLVGPNGSGKSTIACLIAGLLEPSSGRCEGPPITRVSALLLPFGFVPGSVAENIGLKYLGPDAHARCIALLERLDLAGKLNADPAGLSQGEQRKLQVAMTLGKDADCYVLDEPLTHIDVFAKPTVVDAILRATAGRMLVVILHGDEQVHAMFDRVIHIERLGTERSESVRASASAIAWAEHAGGAV